MLSMEQVVRRFATPKRINDFMQVCFDYVPDEEHHGIDEHWQEPYTTLGLKKGDCEDYAVFAWHVLSRHDFEAHVFAAFTEDDGHAVCLVEERRVYFTLSNDGITRLGRLRHRLRGGHVSLARWVADRIYPQEWIACSYVRRFLPGFRPDYEWIHPS